MPSEIVERETVVMRMAHHHLALRQKFKIRRKLTCSHILEEFERQSNDGRLSRCSVFNRGPMEIDMMAWSEVLSCLGFAKFSPGCNKPAIALTTLTACINIHKLEVRIRWPAAALARSLRR